LLRRLYTLSGGPLNFETQVFSLSSQWENPALAIVQYNEKQTNNGTVPKYIDKAEIESKSIDKAEIESKYIDKAETRVKIYRQSGDRVKIYRQSGDRVKIYRQSGDRVQIYRQSGDRVTIYRQNKGNNKITEQSYKGKVKTHNYINRQNQSTTGKL
jgi:predicted esterase YcpF (UPF0227 family)